MFKHIFKHIQNIFVENYYIFLNFNIFGFRAFRQTFKETLKINFMQQQKHFFPIYSFVKIAHCIQKFIE